MNPKLKLSLTVAGAGLAVIGQGSMMSEALAGPSLTGNSTQTFEAGADYNLQYGQSIEVIGNTSNTLNPFQVTAGTVTGVTAVGVLEGNAGTSTLTASFDRNGFGAATNTSSTLATPSFAVQAAIVPLGGQAGTGGITTATSAIIFATPTAVVLNQTSAAGIVVTGAGTDTGIIGASITAENQGASGVTGSFSDSLTVINSLTAF
jgi:hypothetical protein